MRDIEYIPIVMIRPNLADIPQCPLPAGYRMRLFRPGDRETWLAVEQASEVFISIAGQTFDDNFGHDLPAMEKRSFFLVAPDGSDVGTITAWYDRNYRGLPWGRIHWVAIRPEHRGKGLSKAIMAVAMNRLWSLGHRRAVLGTQTPRLPAIRTYLNFGFVPDMRTKDAQRAWSLVARHISHPAMKGL